jgi:predicted deacylase
MARIILGLCTRLPNRVFSQSVEFIHTLHQSHVGVVEITAAPGVRVSHTVFTTGTVMSPAAQATVNAPLAGIAKSNRSIVYVYTQSCVFLNREFIRTLHIVSHRCVDSTSTWS